MNNKFFILSFFLVYMATGAPASYAAMEEEPAGGDLVEMIVFQREQAKQEYNQYITQQAQQQNAVVPAVVPKKAAGPNIPGRSNMILGIVMIITAALLSLRLFKMNKAGSSESK